MGIREASDGLIIAIFVVLAAPFVAWTIYWFFWWGLGL